MSATQTSCTYGFQTVTVGLIEYPVTSSSTCETVDEAAPAGTFELYNALSVMGLFLLALLVAATLWPRSSLRL